LSVKCRSWDGSSSYREERGEEEGVALHQLWRLEIMIFLDAGSVLAKFNQLANCIIADSYTMSDSAPLHTHTCSASSIFLQLGQIVLLFLSPHNFANSTHSWYMLCNKDYTRAFDWFNSQSHCFPLLNGFYIMGVHMVVQLVRDIGGNHDKIWESYTSA
jgi:hypothetical protein